MCLFLIFCFKCRWRTEIAPLKYSAAINSLLPDLCFFSSFCVLSHLNVEVHHQAILMLTQANARFLKETTSVGDLKLQITWVMQQENNPGRTSKLVSSSSTKRCLLQFSQVWAYRQLKWRDLTSSKPAILWNRPVRIMEWDEMPSHWGRVSVAVSFDGSCYLQRGQK